VSITVIPTPPSISLSQPADGRGVLAGSALGAAATATSPEGSIDRVELYANGLLVRQGLAPPFTNVWSPGGTSTFALRAVAVDNWGSAATSAVVTVAFSSGTNLPVTLVAAGSRWKYLDDGSNQGTNWLAIDAPDSDWKNGLAELGYGDTAEGRPEVTLIGYGPDAAN
jgi:hypothetical protein